MRSDEVATPCLEPAVLEQEPHLLLGRERDPVQRRHLVERAGECALHACAVVAPDPDHERVVELAQRLYRFEDSTHVPVRVFRVAGVRLHLPRVQLLLGLGQRVPLRERVVRRQLRFRWHDAELLLARQRLLALDVPTVVETALVLVRPLTRHMMRGVAAAGGVVHEPRGLRPLGANAVQPVDGFLGHVVREVVGLAVLSLRHAPDLLVLGDDGVVLTRLAAQEAPVVVEAEPGGPAVEGTARSLLVVRRHVPLADRGSHVAVLLQDPRQRRAVARDGGVIAGERPRELGHEAEPHAVLVTASEHRRARRRTHRRNVEAVVPESLVGRASVVRRVDRTAEGARVAKPSVVDEDEQDIRGAFWRRDLHRLIPVGHRALEGLGRRAGERRATDRQSRAIDRLVTHPPTSRGVDSALSCLRTKPF
jgi:hypothetical protein